MSDLERIARAIDPEAWLPLYDHDIDGWWYDRRRDSLSAAARVQELLLDPQVVDAAAHELRRDDPHADAYNLDDYRNMAIAALRAALGVAEQPEGRVPE